MSITPMRITRLILVVFAACLTISKCQAAGANEKPAALRDIENISQLKTLFNQQKGTTRLIVIFSPTCPGCVQGASLVQKLLDASPKANLSVFAVWLPMLPADDRSEWNLDLLDDPRVTHFWDRRAKVAGAWFREHVKELKRDKAPGLDGMQGNPTNRLAAWDVYFLYGPDATWEERPKEIVSWGRPVFRTEKPLRAALTGLVDADD